METEQIEFGPKSLFTHMTSFDKNQKAEYINMVQYGFMATIPVLLINKGIGELFSPNTEDKTTIELSLEVTVQLFLLISSIYLVHRLVTYIPTYSETPYSGIDFIGTVLVFILIIFSFQTHVNEKAQIVFQNVYSIVTGHVSDNVSTQTKPTSHAPLLTPNAPTQTNPPPEFLNQQAVQVMPPTTTQSVSHTAMNNQVANNQIPEFNYDQFHDSGAPPMAANESGGFSSSFF
jgi:general stress protein CsbA